MKKYILTLILILIPNILLAGTFVIPSTRTYSWQGNVGVTYCKNTSYYTQATCEGAGSVWYTDIPTDRTQSGSTITATSGDRTSTIQTAINNAVANTYVLLGAGNFNFTKLTMKSGVTLRGSGKGITTLTNTSTSSTAAIKIGTGSNATLGSAVNLSSGYTLGSTSIVTSSAHGWSAGDYVLFNQVNSTSAIPSIHNSVLSLDGRMPAHMVRISAVPNSTTVTLDVPFGVTLTAGQSPTGKKITSSMIIGAGLEDLTIENVSSVACCPSEGLLSLASSSNCWIKNVEVNGIGRLGLWGAETYRPTIRGNDLHNNVEPRSSDYGYAFWVGYGWFSNGLTENNAIYDDHSAYIVNGAAVASVFAYNYATDLECETSQCPSPGGQNSTQAIYHHGDAPVALLWEGNYVNGGTSGGDHETNGETGAGSAYITFFRNKLHGRSDFPNQRIGLGWVDPYHLYSNSIGNILGQAGYTATYDNCTEWFPGSGAYGFLTATQGNGCNGNSRLTMLRHGSYDYYNNSQKWCTDSGEIGCQGSTGTDQTLSSSLYLSSQPPSTWWCSESTWPPVNPAGGSDALRYSKIPAQIRYEGGTCTLGGSGGPSAPTGFSGGQIVGGQIF